MISKSGKRFWEKIMLHKRLEWDGDAKNAHPVLMHRRNFLQLLHPVLLGVILIPPQLSYAQASAAEPEPTPEERMRRRFPQPVKVGDLIGLPLLDYGDSTIGFVRDVVRTPAGKIVLVVNQGWFFGRGGRLVGVPIEVVAILARQVNLLDISREDFARAPTWSDANGMQIPRDQKIQIALGRR
jgi:hypothetical protein